MAIYKVGSPDGKVHRFEGPDGLSQDQVLDEASSFLFDEPPTRDYSVGQIASKALGRGTERLKSTFGDAIPAMIGNALGFEDYAKQQMAEAQDSEEYIQRKLAPQYPSYKDVSGVGSGLEFALETGLEQVPNLLTTLIPGGIAGQTAKIGTAKLAATELAKRQATAQSAGVYLGSYALNAPEIFQNVYQETGELATGTAVIFGAAAAALDAVLPDSILKGMSPATRGAIAKAVLKKSGTRPGLANTAFKGFLKGAGQEGVTEGMQEAISIAAENFVGDNPQIFNSADWDRIMESSVRGAVAGGVFRGISAPIEQKVQELGQSPIPVPIERATEFKDEGPGSDIKEVLDIAEPPPAVTETPTTTTTTTPGSVLTPVATTGTQLTLPGIPEEPAGPVKREITPEQVAGTMGLVYDPTKNLAYDPKTQYPYKWSPESLTWQPLSRKEKNNLGAKQPYLEFPSLPVPGKNIGTTQGLEGPITDGTPFSAQATKESLAQNMGLQYDDQSDTAYDPETQLTYQWSPEGQTWQETNNDTTTQPIPEGAGAVGASIKIPSGTEPGAGTTPTGETDGRPVGSDRGDGKSTGGREGIRDVPLKTPAATFTGAEIAREAQEMGSDQGGISDFTAEQIAKEDYNSEEIQIQDIINADKDLKQYIDTTPEVREFEDTDASMDPIISSTGEVIDGYNRIHAAYLRGDKTISVLKGQKTQASQKLINQTKKAEGGRDVPLDPKTPVAKGWASFISELPYAKLGKALKTRVSEAIQDGYFTSTLAQEILTVQKKNNIKEKQQVKPIDEDTTIEPSTFDSSFAPNKGAPFFTNAQQVIEELYAAFGKKRIDNFIARGKLLVLDSINDIENPNLRAGASNALAFFAFGKRDRYTSGKTYIIANRNRQGSARSLLLHEVGEHYGLEGMLGSEYLTILLQLKRLKDTDPVVKAAWDRTLRLYTPSDPVVYREGSKKFLRETAAALAETAPENNWVKKIMSRIKNFLRKLGLYDPSKITREDLQDMILYSLDRRLDTKDLSTGNIPGEDLTIERSIYSASEPPGGYTPRANKKLLAAVKEVIQSIPEATPGLLKDIRLKISEYPNNARKISMQFLGLPNIVQLYKKYVPSFATLLDFIDRRAAKAGDARNVVDIMGNIGIDIVQGAEREVIKLVNKETGKEVTLEDLYNGTARVYNKIEMEKIPNTYMTDKKGNPVKYDKDTIKKWTQLVYALSRGERGNPRLENGIDPTDPANAYNPLVGQFKQMPAELQMIAITYSSYFQSRADAFNKAILKLLPNTDMKGKAIPPSKKAEAYKEYLIDNKLVFYHPFLRKGEYVLEYYPKGKRSEADKYVERYESPLALQERMAEVIKSGGEVIQSGVSPERKRMVEAPPSEFFQKVIGTIRETLGNQAGSDPASEKLIDEIYGFYIDMFPSADISQNTRKRSGVHGEREDIVGGFAEVAARMAHQVTNMEYIPDFNKTFVAIQEEATIAGQDTIIMDDTIEPAEKTKLIASIKYAAADVTEAGRSFIINPVADPLSSKLAYVSYMTTIAGNVSSALVNLSQLAFIVGPGLIAKHGFVKGTKALKVATSLYFSGGKDNNKAWQGVYGLGGPDISFGTKNGVLRTKENAAKGLIDQADVLPDELIELYTFGVDTSVFRRGLGYELTEIRRTDSKDFTGTRSKVESLLGWIFQNTERANREITFLASYLVETNSSLLKGDKNEVSNLSGVAFNDKAAEIAREFTRDSHGTSLVEVGPRLFQTSWGKTVGTFKRYAHSMVSLMARLFYESTKGGDARRSELAKLITETADPIKIAAYEQEMASLKLIKYVARKQLVGIYGMSFVLAGVQGMPLYGAAQVTAEVMNSLFGDDDEPYDFNESARDLFGELGYRGPMNKILGVDTASRTAFSNLFFRESPRRVEQIGLPGYILETALGPAWSYTNSVAKGIKDMSEGEFQRGVEQVLPAFLRNPLKAMRYVNEGARTRNGAPLMEDIGAFSAFMQVFGFSNAELSLIYERNNTMKEEERKMLERRQGILKAAFLAKQSGDLELQGVIRKRIQKYNASTQGRLNPITGRTITTSVKQREKAIEDSVDGITLTKSYKDYLIEELGS
jgi:hypothetical protein